MASHSTAEFNKLVPAVGRNGIGNLHHFYDDPALMCPACPSTTPNRSNSVMKKLVRSPRISRTFTATVDGSTSSVSCTRIVYTSPLVKDAKQRTDRRIRCKKEREDRGLSSDPKAPLRTGRGGAGLAKRAEKVDSGIYPETAALARAHEVRIAAQEQALFEDSRARAFEASRMGRGGSGNMTQEARERRLAARQLKKALTAHAKRRRGFGRATVLNASASKASTRDSSNTSLVSILSGSELVQSFGLRHHSRKPSNAPINSTRTDLEEDCTVIVIGRPENDVRGILDHEEGVGESSYERDPSAYTTAEDYFRRRHSHMSIGFKFRISLESVMETLEI